jgi:hypothetical protein
MCQVWKIGTLSFHSWELLDPNGCHAWRSEHQHAFTWDWEGTALPSLYGAQGFACTPVFSGARACGSFGVRGPLGTGPVKVAASVNRTGWLGHRAIVNLSPDIDDNFFHRLEF